MDDGATVGFWTFPIPLSHWKIKGDVPPLVVVVISEDPPSQMGFGFAVMLIVGNSRVITSTSACEEQPLSSVMITV